MRKSKKEAAETRQRIVEVAAAEFRKNGVKGIGLNDLMASAGLTHGGFYRHFDSKDQLVAEAYACAIDQVTGRINSAGGGDYKKNRFAAYLSKQHRNNPASGCPIAAIGSEIVRCGAEARKAATEGFKKLVGIFAGPSGSDAKSDEQALVDTCTMIGALTMSRIVDDPALSDEILQLTENHLVGHVKEEN